MDNPRSKILGSSSSLAIIFMLIAAMLSAFDAVIVRLLAHQVHPFVIAFFRSLFGLMAVLPWLLARRKHLASHYRYMHIVRAIMKISALVCFFFAFATAQLADVTAIMFTAPIFLTIGGWFVFGEKYSSGRLIAVLAGFIGVIIVIRPGEGDITWALFYALLGSALTAAIQLILKKMAQHDSAETLVAWNLISMVPLAAIPAIYFWATPTLPQLGLLAAQGMLGALNMTLMTRALSMAEASLIAPLDFVRLPTVALLAFLFFGEVASVETWIGASIIFFSTLLVAGSARWHGRRKS